VNELSLPGEFGWMVMLWPRSNTEDADLYQTWIDVQQDILGYSSARPAAALDNANCAWSGGVFGSGFEWGNTGGWTGDGPR